eukprot:TRINITY_DN835_c0_g1_i1.p1 TRINITY_DN835_c0_g1~~TRINITY_DN835_c0_g1_i1.p1  ORF type:complete len:158 (-),score=41.88 TRINITY_DN835_c0_g1_i1:85-510(-)
MSGVENIVRYFSSSYAGVPWETFQDTTVEGATFFSDSFPQIHLAKDYPPFLAECQKSFNKWVLTIDDVFATETHGAIRYTSYVTFGGQPLPQGIQPTGKTCKFQSIAVIQLKGGRITAIKKAFDLHSMNAQLGIPAETHYH